MSDFARRSARTPRWLRTAALFVALFAAPATQQLVEHMAGILHGMCVEPSCCAGEEKQDASPAPRSCEHCACCAPAGVLTAGVAPLIAPLASERIAVLAPDDVCAAGFRTQPFRPPAG